VAIHVGRIDNEGSDSAQGRTVTEYWQVIEDTGDACAIGPVAVSLLPELPSEGMPYIPEPGCDTVDTSLLCSSVNIGRLKKDPKGHCWREVTVRYSQPGGSGGGGGRTNPNFGVVDPLLWTPELELSTVFQKKEVDFLPFMGGFTLGQFYQNTDPDPFNPCLIGTVTDEGELPDANADGFAPIENNFCNRAIGEIALVGSSANEPFYPRESLEFSDLQIRYTFYSNNYDPNDLYACYRGIAVNDRPLHLNVQLWNFDIVMPKHTAKMKNIIGKPGFRQWKDALGATVERYYWKTTFEIQYRKLGWYIDKLNVGHVRPARGVGEDKPDGFGGWFAYNDDFHEGMAPVAPIKGPDGTKVQRPVPLKIDGQPALDAQNPTILRYLDGYEMNFDDPQLGLPLYVEPD
jgi:hypothetical protein